MASTAFGLRRGTLAASRVGASGVVAIRRRFAQGLALALVTASFCSVGEASDRPNLLVLITDDQRWDMLGAVTDGLHTPEMDRLAAEGVRFVNAFATTSICAASRASLLTGLHERTHRYTFRTIPLRGRLVENSYPTVLRAAGYETGYIGKFGVKTTAGSVERLFDDFQPIDRNPYWKVGEDGGRRHATDLTADRAIDFIERRNSRPFCLTVGFNAPHAEDADPRQYVWPPSADGLYEDLLPPAAPTGEPAFYDSLPPYLTDGTMNRDRWRWRFDDASKRRDMIRGYYRMISGVDHAIGRIRAALRDRGLERDTVILLLSDNGYFLGERGYAGKWLPYEPSIRIPLILYDPRAADDRSGAEPTPMALNIDVAPTLLDLAGVAPPEGMQGRSLVDLVESEPADWRAEVFVEHLMQEPRIRKHEGVRTERYKYVRYFEASPVLEELYDLREDPHETKNLVADPDHASVVATLRATTDRLRDRYTRAGSESGIEGD